MTKNIMLFSRDPGGANVIFPLVIPLIQKGYKVNLYGKDIAVNKYKEHKVNGTDIMKFIQYVNYDNILSFIRNNKFHFVITATSAVDFTEKYIWKACENLGIPCFAILDQWVNYGIRFSEYAVNEISDYYSHKEHKYLPTKILVMDRYAESKMLEEGIKAEKILVTGQPYFDYLLKIKDSISLEKIHRCRKKFKCNKEDILVLYASEPWSKVYGDVHSKKNYFGYTEKTIFSEIYKGFTKILTKTNKKLRIIIRPHPREDLKEWFEYIEKLNIESKYINIIIDKDADQYEAITSSDLILGMASMFLLEAAIFNKPIMSVQIGLKCDNPFILDQKGIIKSILNEKDLEKELYDFVIKKEYKKNDLDFNYGSVEKVIKYMEEIICQN